MIGWSNVLVNFNSMWSITRLVKYNLINWLAVQLYGWRYIDELRLVKGINNVKDFEATHNNI